MIKSIITSSPWLLVTNGNPGTPYISPSSTNPATGMMRYNGQDIEVYDGSYWQRLSSHAIVDLNGAANSAIAWAQNKMYEESRIKELAANNETIADALAKYELAAEQLKVVLTLTAQPK
jgi:hypothetical protein